MGSSAKIDYYYNEEKLAALRVAPDIKARQKKTPEHIVEKIGSS